MAIDFETANNKRTSACAIGLAIVERGKIVDTFYSLIKPEPQYFLPLNIGVHGLTEKDVKNSPSFKSLWPDIRKILKARHLLAHNAPFDRSVLKACLQHYAINFPQPDFSCSCMLARAAFPRAENHRLPTICHQLKIQLDHHKALADAIACAKIAIQVSKVKGFTLDDCRLNYTEW